MKPGESRIEPWRPLAVEFEAAPTSGMFTVDERLRVDELTLGTDASVATARVAVRLDDGFDALAARNRYLPDCRVVIRTDEPIAADRSMLFEGYPLAAKAEWDGRPGRRRDDCVLTVEHVYGRLSRDRRSWVYGRRMRTGAIEDGLAADPAAWSHASELVTALPCVFNANGVGNCSPTPITVKALDGSARSIYVFTDDLDAGGRRWTYLNALRYLFWFHADSQGPVGEGNLFAATDAYVNRDPDDSRGDLPNSEMARRLLEAPDGLGVEACHLVEALRVVAASCGVHVTGETVNVAGRAVSQVRCWAAGDGEIRDLPLARGGRDLDGTPRFDAAAMSAAEVYANNVVERVSVEWDHRAVVNAPVVIGGVKHYEMTMPLVPGWAPEAGLDNVAELDRDAAKEDALTPTDVEFYGEDAQEFTWYKRYHKKGVDFADYGNVGRLWVLNEDGRFDDATYGRNFPFDQYAPFDFSSVSSAAVTTAGAWTRRVRRLLNTITVAEDGTRFGVHAEVSFNGGVSWFDPGGAVRVRTDPTGIYFDVDNPTEIAPPDTVPDIYNMWYAMVDQTFRVRVTALVAGDDRLIIRHAADARETPTLWTTSRVVYRPTTYRFESRTGTSNVLAGVSPEATDIEMDDSDAARVLADRLASDERDGRLVVCPTVPWVETSLRIGDRVSGIGSRGLSFGSRVSRKGPLPSVLGKRFRFSSGRLETELVLGLA